MKRNNYRQLTPEERHTIQVMNQARKSIRAIAQLIHRAPSTVSRELRRNRDPATHHYEHAEAQTKAQERRAADRRGFRPRTRRAWWTLEHLIRHENRTAGQAALQRIGICERTCYRLIWADRRDGGNLYRLLPRGRRPNRRGGGSRPGPIKNRRGIDERSAKADDRKEFGHWEGDLVEGLRGKSYLLTLRDRKSRLGLILRLLGKRSATVTNALIRQLLPFRSTFRSLTLDNGGEFAGHITVASELGRPGSVYFARPYRASDKGSVEQLNGMIRRWYPKQTDFRLVSRAELDRLQDHLNCCPMHVTGGRAPITFAKRLIKPW